VHQTGRRFVPREELDRLCPERLAGVALDGLWVAGSLDGLAAPAVAVVGTRSPSAATATASIAFAGMVATRHRNERRLI